MSHETGRKVEDPFRLSRSNRRKPVGILDQQRDMSEVINDSCSASVAQQWEAAAIERKASTNARKVREAPTFPIPNW